MSNGDLVSKKGWLKKQGGLVRSWQDRWFVLRGKSLQYFTKEDVPKQQGCIELDGCKLVEIPYSRDEPDKWLFTIGHAQRGGKANETYLLWAESEADRVSWLSVLRRAVYKSIGGGVFGGPLHEITRYDRKFYNCEVPHVVKQCVELIMEDGKEVEGIFRLSGRLAQVKEMRRRYDEGERPNLTQEHLDIHTTASLLKLYFRELPQPVIPFEHFESFLSLATSFRYNSNHEQTFQSLKSLVRQIPDDNYNLLDYLTGFLLEISKYQHINKMTEKNIAVIFGTNILRGQDDTPEFQMATQNLTTHVVLALVKWHDLLFSKSAEPDAPALVDEQDFEHLVSLSAEPADAVTETTPESAAVEDLLGVDFTPASTTRVSTAPGESRRAPPPIPTRAQDTNRKSDSEMLPNGGDLTRSTQSLDSNHSAGSSHQTATPKNIAGNVTRRDSSMRNKPRPTAILQPESTSPATTPPQRKSDSLPITRMERGASNFTSFIDSPLDQCISLNIGDLPDSVEDLQALVLSLKLQLKEQRRANEKLIKDGQCSATKHQQQMENLAKSIYQERQAKDDAIARVMTLAQELVNYKSHYGTIDSP